ENAKAFSEIPTEEPVVFGNRGSLCSWFLRSGTFTPGSQHPFFCTKIASQGSPAEENNDCFPRKSSMRNGSTACPSFDMGKSFRWAIPFTVCFEIGINFLALL